MHQPVLLRKFLPFFSCVTLHRFVDTTIGLGGHSREILRGHPHVKILGIDLDQKSLDLCRQNLTSFGSRLTLKKGNFSSIQTFMRELGWDQAEGILADLGISSYQLSRFEKGFSFSGNGPLDMRMGEQGRTAAGVINNMDQVSLAHVFRTYGEERMANKIAKAVVHNRPINDTRELRELIHHVKGPREGRLDSATRIFQALRIAVNDELTHLEGFVPEAIQVLSPGGRLAIISFHSLEDRIVKRMFHRFSGRCTCPPGVPVCSCRPQRAVKILTRKPVRPSEQETNENPRSRSAKMRVVEKL